jgi:hypothetical protein
MPTIANFKNLATSDRFIQDTKEIVLQDLFAQDSENFFTFVPGIKGGQQVAAMRGFEYVTKASAGCGGTGISPVFPAFSQTWNPKLAEVKIQYCYSDFESSFLQWGLNNGYQRKNLDGTAMALFIQDLVVKAMKLDLQRIILMGDATIATQNILTDATKAPFYNVIDKGLIPTLQYLKTLPEFASAFYTIDKNAALTTADQYTLTSTYALDIFEKMIFENYQFDADSLFSSNRMFRNYEAFLRRANGYPVQANVDKTVMGVDRTAVSGMDVTPIINYDRWRNTDFVTGGKVYVPHFALLTRKEHLQVGIDDSVALENLTLEYIGGDKETFYIKGNYMFDFKMVNPYAFKAAL